jgi:hypothetical protein
MFFNVFKKLPPREEVNSRFRNRATGLESEEEIMGRKVQKRTSFPGVLPARVTSRKPRLTLANSVFQSYRWKKSKNDQSLERVNCGPLERAPVVSPLARG